MADKETPSYINYGEAPQGDFSGSDLIKYFTETMFKLKRVSILITSVQERSMAKRWAKEYEADTIKLVIDYAITHVQPKHYNKIFTGTYAFRHQFAERLQEKEQDYGWS